MLTGILYTLGCGSFYIINLPSTIGPKAVSVMSSVMIPWPLINTNHQLKGNEKLERGTPKVMYVDRNTLYAWFWSSFCLIYLPSTKVALGRVNSCCKLLIT